MNVRCTDIEFILKGIMWQLCSLLHKYVKFEMHAVQNVNPFPNMKF